MKSDKIISELEGILEVQMYYFVFRSVTLTYYSVTYFFQAMVLKYSQTDAHKSSLFPLTAA